MDDRVKTYIGQGDHLFGKKKPFDALCQDIAENFFPERADFTVSINTGDELASNLTTSIPVLARRDLANSFSAMLRPKDKRWFQDRVMRMDRVDNEGLRWLDWATEIHTNALYDRVSGFVKATKQGDNDYSAFGQCVIKGQFNVSKNALLFQNKHLRDVAWSEGADGNIDSVHVNDRYTAAQLFSFFGKKVHHKILECLEGGKDTYREFKVRHCVIPIDQYGGSADKMKFKTPYISFYFDCENNHIMEEVGSHNMMYVIPRWQTVSGSQYAYSPATVVALADARLIQAMTLTLLEAGEKAVNPPMIAAQDMIKSDISVYAGGVTWVDADYDERMGDVLRPISQNTSAIPLGIEMQRDVETRIGKAFYLDKVSLPPVSARMTAFEMGQRVSEYVRNAAPLFEPMEDEYNAALCDLSFDILLRNGGFGASADIPKSLAGQEMRFTFKSPLQEAREHQKSQIFLETKAMLAEAAALDPSVVRTLDVKSALRDVLGAISTPAKWIVPAEDVAAMEQQEMQAQQAQQAVAALAQGGQVAEQVGAGVKALAEAGLGG